MKPCILIFGMPRSGTTWIGKLFDSHPDTLYRHEPDSVRKLSFPRFPDLKDAGRYREELEQFVAALPRMRSSEVVGKQPLFPKSYQSHAALTAYRACVVASKAASRVWRHFPCMFRPTGENQERVRVVWKSIESPGRLGVCVEALPSARAIHLMRHPCGYVASVLRGRIARRFAHSEPSDDWLLKMLFETAAGKARGMTARDLDQLTLEERLAWCWVLTHEKIIADIAQSEQVMTVRYEDVCVDPKAVTRRMLEFTGLDWHTQVQRFILASTQSEGTGYYSIFKNPYASAERWRSELASPVVDRILGVLRSSELYRFYCDSTNAPRATVGTAS